MHQLGSIDLDNLQGADVAALLQQHLDDMRSVSPPESKHALDLEGLRAVDISFWALRDDHKLVGCIALKELDTSRGEVKSMRVDNCHRGKGFGRRLVQHVIDAARERGYRELLLETGSMDYFAPARELYSRFGFEPCGPFGNYVEDPNSVFMRLSL